MGEPRKGTPGLGFSLRAPQGLARRQREIDSQPNRSEFVRDRDRILYSTAFRRLSGKTQMFTATHHDDTRTRLTHSIQVAQISRTLARWLDLDEDLAEAIALGHDIGHTPFGHVGERVLNCIMNNCDTLVESRLISDPSRAGFKHNLQSVRVAVDLERGFRNPAGLNLTNFTLFGLGWHSRTEWRLCDYYSGEGEQRCHLHYDPTDCERCGRLRTDFYARYDRYLQVRDPADASGQHPWAWSFEARVVELGDEISQRHHDLEDGIYAQIISPQQVTRWIWEDFGPFIAADPGTLRNFKAMRAAEDKMRFTTEMTKFIIHFLAEQLLAFSREQLAAFAARHRLHSREEFEARHGQFNYQEASACIGFAPDFATAQASFKERLKNRILESYLVQSMNGKGTFIIRQLFRAYLDNPQQLPNPTIVRLYRQCLPEELPDDPPADLTETIGNLRHKLERVLRRDPRYREDMSRVICDYIAGMTDSYALGEYHRLYG